MMGCSEKAPRATPKNSTAIQERGLYEQGLKALSRNDYKGAAQSFSELLRKYPSTTWLTGAYYNLGLALEGQNDFKGAEDKYSKIIELAKSQSRDEADALYRLSICDEALGNDEKIIFSLLQLQNLIDFLPKRTADMEIPARLAAAYARQNNLNQAKKYYEKAVAGLKKYRRPPLEADILIWLPKTLYSMGNIHPIRKDVTLQEFRDYLESIKEIQGWLVRAIELGNNQWSRKAADKLEDIYLDLVVAIRDFKVADNSDRFLAAKERQETQKKMASLLDECITKLKLERLPSSPEDPEPGRLTEAFKTVADVEKRVDQIIQRPDVQDQDTPEAQERQGLRR
jgi:tetratricopeptide (TPR) repeat protein